MLPVRIVFQRNGDAVARREGLDLVEGPGITVAMVDDEPNRRVRATVSTIGDWPTSTHTGAGGGNPGLATFKGDGSAVESVPAEDDELTREGSSLVWSPPRGRRKRWGHWNARGLFSALHGMGWDNAVLVGGTASAVYTGSAYFNLGVTTAGAAGNASGYTHVKPVTTGRLKPRFHALVRLYDITATTYWIGFPRYATLPTHAAAYVQEHAMVRFVSGTDTKLMASVGDGAAQLTAEIDVTPASLGMYEVEIDGNVQTDYRFRARALGATWSPWVTLSTNTPFANTMCMAAMCVNQDATSQTIGVCYADVDTF